MHCRQWLATAATFLWSCLAQELNRGVGPNTRYTLRSNTTRTIRFDLINIWSLAQTIRILGRSRIPTPFWTSKHRLKSYRQATLQTIATVLHPHIMLHRHTTINNLLQTYAFTKADLYSLTFTIK